MLPNDGQKHSIQFYNSASVETDASELNYVVIAATDQMLDEIGGLILASGARFPSDETTSRTFRFNKITAQELIWIGLQLMGAGQLLFDASWFDSPDSNFHASFEQDPTNKGHWFLRLENPEFTDGTDGREVEFDNDGTYIRWRYIGDSGWTNLVSLASITGENGTDGTDGINGSDGSDGNDGSDGREIELRVSGGYIQWEYTTGDTWHNLIAVSALEGPQGEQGIQGIPGNDGIDGEDGADGVDTSSPPDLGLTPSDETRCSVAVAVVEYVYATFTGALRINSTQRSEVVAGSGGIGLALGLIFPGIGALIASGVAAAALYNTLLDIEANGYIPFFDTDVKSDLKCILLCLLASDGHYTESIHTSFIDKINDNPDTLYQLIADVVEKSGYKAFQWGAQSAPLLASPDCDDCDCGWCYRIDFTDNDGDFATLAGLGLGDWVSGQGWNVINAGTGVSMYIGRSLPSGRYTKIELDVTSATSGGNFDTDFNGSNMWTDENPVTKTYVWTGNVVDPGSIGLNPSGVPANSLLRLTSIRFSGLETLPTGFEDNCS